jgi:hypothetical protein
MPREARVSEIDGPLGEWLADRIPKLAKLAHRRFTQVPAEDFEQEMWLRAFKRKAKLAKWLREDHDGLVWKELRAAATRLGSEDDRYRRAVKAAGEGYRVFDEVFYSTGMLAQVLPVLVMADFDVAEAVAAASHQTDAAGVHISADDPESKGNYQVILMDVAMAYQRLNGHDKSFLRKYYGTGGEDTEQGRWDRQGIASSMGMTYEAFRKQANRALRRLQAELGGEDPWRKQDRDAA